MEVLDDDKMIVVLRFLLILLFRDLVISKSLMC